MPSAVTFLEKQRTVEKLLSLSKKSKKTNYACNHRGEDTLRFVTLQQYTGAGIDCDKTSQKAGWDWVSEGVEGGGDSDRVEDRDAVRPV